MSELSTREVPGRSLGCLNRNVARQQGHGCSARNSWRCSARTPSRSRRAALEPPFALLGRGQRRHRRSDRVAPTVPDDQAHALAVKVPELALRTANAIAAGAGRI
jgi:hypothetical protein